MTYTIRRLAYAALTAGLLGGAARAEEPGTKAGPDSTFTSRLKDRGVTAAGDAQPAPAAAPIPAPVVAGPVAGPSVLAGTTACPPPAAPAACSFYGGVGLVYLQPYISENTAFILTNPAPTPGGAIPVAVGSVVDVPFNWDHGVGWQAWAGYSAANGWGVRLGTFCFDDDADTVTRVNAPTGTVLPIITVPPIIPPIPGAASFGGPTAVLAAAGLGVDRVTFQSDLDIRYCDVEATYSWTDPCCLVRLSGGGRWLNLRQEYVASVVNLGDGVTTERQRLDSVREFTGGGPTIGLFVRGGLGNGLAGYGSVRGSILFGQLDQHATFEQDISDPNLTALVGTQQTRTRFDSGADHVLTVGEIELGVEYGAPLGGGARGFVRAGILGQAYANAGSATTSGGTLGLFGGVLAVGVDY